MGGSAAVTLFLVVATGGNAAEIWSATTGDPEAEAVLVGVRDGPVPFAGRAVSETSRRAWDAALPAVRAGLAADRCTVRSKRGLRLLDALGLARMSLAATLLRAAERSESGAPALLSDELIDVQRMADRLARCQGGLYALSLALGIRSDVREVARVLGERGVLPPSELRKVATAQSAPGVGLQELKAAIERERSRLVAASSRFDAGSPLFRRGPTEAQLTRLWGLAEQGVAGELPEWRSQYDRQLGAVLTADDIRVRERLGGILASNDPKEQARLREAARIEGASVDNLMGRMFLVAMLPPSNTFEEARRAVELDELHRRVFEAGIGLLEFEAGGPLPRPSPGVELSRRSAKGGPRGREHHWRLHLGDGLSPPAAATTMLVTDRCVQRAGEHVVSSALQAAFEARGTGVVTSEVRVVPAFTGGRAVGFKVFGIAPNTWQSCGIENGDVITVVNGIEMLRPETIEQAAESIRRDRRAVISLRRRGKTESVTIRGERR